MASRDEASAEPPLVLMDLDASTPPLAAIRRRIADALADLSTHERHAVLLVATELVTNAYEHAWFACQIRLWRIRRPDVVLVEVDDISPYPPVLGLSQLDETRGNGLRLVDNFTTRWGTTAQAAGKTVWAQIGLHSPIDAAAPTGCR
ncbi:ATP-binding protein [Lentzea sp. E54]|uniref:ATP-binding protein n=1 Tax=Lentzea xerophila TaxID=3435883 RepID=UPI003DA54859